MVSELSQLVPGNCNTTLMGEFDCQYCKCNDYMPNTLCELHMRQRVHPAVHARRRSDHHMQLAGVQAHETCHPSATSHHKAEL